MTIKKRVKLLQKRKENYLKELEEITTEFEKGYLLGSIRSINEELNYLEDLWLDGVENVW